MFKEGRKVGRKSVLCHWKGFAKWEEEEQGEAGREGGIDGGTRLRRKRAALERIEDGEGKISCDRSKIKR